MIKKSKMEKLSNELLIMIIKNVFEDKNLYWEMEKMFKVNKRLYWLEKGIINFEQLKKDYELKINKKIKKGNRVIKLPELGKIFRRKIFRKSMINKWKNGYLDIDMKISR